MGETLLRYRDDEASTAPAVSFGAFADAGNAAAVRMEPGVGGFATVRRLLTDTYSCLCAASIRICAM